MKILLATVLYGSLGVTAPPAATTFEDSMVSCTAQRLSHFVGPFGVMQSWPVATHLPEFWGDEPGVLLSDSGDVMDGDTHHLHVKPESRSAYVVQQGGFSGSQKVFGPLPVASCAPRSRRGSRSSS